MTQRTGFTLIEVLVAIGILSIVLVIMGGLFSRFIAAQRRDIAELAVQEDVRSSMEFMSREIRTGYGSTFAVDQAVPQAAGFIFRNQNGDCVEYRSVNGSLQRAMAAAPPSQECDRDVHFGTYTAITGVQTNIAARFIPPQGTTHLNRQAFVTVVVHAVSATNTAAAPLDLETTITSRQIQAYE